MSGFLVLNWTTINKYRLWFDIVFHSFEITGIELIGYYVLAIMNNDGTHKKNNRYSHPKRILSYCHVKNAICQLIS